ncbi:VOC family protein [Sandaracinus amylolyticus]|uniref:Glyoxalase family protein n=1 Tax=Sandaracinus amylolyticus TaxID=927083 RepID=A0A0F6W1Z8_9BACT|nr:VOC family protein [Sandaracinus amylolyticus]AKF05246.1 Glyoxalase family protein [Sandaracinus amylolyticus]
MTTNHSLVPHLIVEGAPAAIDFYVGALGAREIERFATPSGRVIHAALEIAGARFTLAEEHREWRNVAPRALGGSSVVLRLRVDDPDAVAERALGRGARVIFPIADQPYGAREGRVEDPFGHLWILSKPLRDVPRAEMDRLLASYDEG